MCLRIVWYAMRLSDLRCHKASREHTSGSSWNSLRCTRRIISDGLLNGAYRLDFGRGGTEKWKNDECIMAPS